MSFTNTNSYIQKTYRDKMEGIDLLGVASVRNFEFLSVGAFVARVVERQP